MQTRQPVLPRTTGLLSLLALLGAVPAAAQKPGWLLPSRDHYPRLLAGARDPVTTAKMQLITESVSRFGNGLEGDVALGTTIPLVRFTGTSPRDALVLGGEGAVFGRFSLQVNSRDIITSDWIFALPLILHRGSHWYRWRYYHMSGHLGDEYRDRFEETAINYGRDAMDLTAYHRLVPWLGAYGMLNWAYNVHPNAAKRFAVRVGLQTEYAANDPRSLIPFAAVDVEMPQDNDWEPKIDVQAGFWLPEVDGRRDVRIAAEFYTGPSPQGQFWFLHTTYFTVGIVIDL